MKTCCGTHLKRLSEVLLMSNTCFHGKLRKISQFLGKKNLSGAMHLAKFHGKVNWRANMGCPIKSKFWKDKRGIHTYHNYEKHHDKTCLRVYEYCICADYTVRLTHALSDQSMHISPRQNFNLIDMKCKLPDCTYVQSGQCMSSLQMPKTDIIITQFINLLLACWAKNFYHTYIMFMFSGEEMNNGYTKKSSPGCPYHKWRNEHTTGNTETIRPYSHEEEHNYKHY